MIRLSRSLDGRRVLRWACGLEMRLHNLLAGMALLLATAAVGVISISQGMTDTGLLNVLSALSGQAVGDAQAYAILDVRLPRVVLGFMVGGCVALTGAMLQSLARNPLADPGLLGMSQGAMAMVLFLMVCFPEVSQAWAPLAAFAGGLGVALLLLALTRRRQADGLAIVLMGIAVETSLSSLTAILLLYTPPDTSFALSAWLAGSLFHSDWAAVGAFLPWFALGLLALAAAGPVLRGYELGEHMAMALGEDVARSRPALLVVVVLLTSAALTAVGPLMFLGIIAPHLAGFVSPSTGRARLLLAALMGGLLVVGADTLTRTATSEVALPVGLSLMLIGAPLFIVSLRLRVLRGAGVH